LQSAKILIRL